MLKDVMNERWKEAYKNKDIVGKSTFESVKAKILVEEKSGKYELPLSDNVVEGIIAKEVKEIEETKSFYKVGDAKYDELSYKVSLLSGYLPKQLDEDEVRAIINKLKDGESNVGKLIGLTIKEVGNKFDKSKISALVKEILQK